MIVTKQPTGSAKFVVKKNGANLHWLQIINPTAGEDVYLHLFDKESRNGTITDYSGTVAGTVLLTVQSGIGLGHGLGNAGVEVAGVEVLSTNHSGAKTVTIVDEWSFYFTDTYVADDAMVFWLGEITLGTTVPTMTIKAPGADVDAYAGGFVSILDAKFDEGIIGAITTTLNGSTGAPTAPVHTTYVF